jgi:CHAT domain-containing protein/tetratricopeptide (TPR) repeat protein
VDPHQPRGTSAQLVCAVRRSVRLPKEMSVQMRVQGSSLQQSSSWWSPSARDLPVPIDYIPEGAVSDNGTKKSFNSLTDITLWWPRNLWNGSVRRVMESVRWLPVVAILSMCPLIQASAQSVNPGSASALIQRAYLCSLTDSLALASALYRQALATLGREGNPAHVLYCLNGIGEILLRQGKSSLAERWLSKAIPSHSKNPAIEGHIRARTLELAATAYLQLDQPDKALQCALDGLSLMISHTSGDSSERANLHAAAGLAHQMMGLYDLALSDFKGSLSFRPPDDSTSVAVLRTFLNIAVLNALRGENDSTLIFVDRVRARIDTTRKEYASLQPAVLTTLSFIESANGLYTQARQLQQQSLSVDERLMGKDNALLAGQYRGIADRFFEEGEYEKALVHADRAIHLLRGRLGESSTLLALAYGAKANTLWGLNRESEALTTIERALAIYAHRRLTMHPSVAWLLETKAGILYATGRFKDALQSNRRAQALRLLYSAPTERYDIIRLLSQEGEILSSMRRYSAADSVQHCAWDLCERSSARSLLQVAGLRRSLALTALRQGRWHEAAEHADAVLNIAGYPVSGVNASRDVAAGLRFVTLAVDALIIRSESQVAASHAAGDSIDTVRQALASLESAIRISEHERRTYSGEETRIAHGSKRAELYENAVELALSLARKTGDASFKMRALLLSDRRKAWTLREEVAWRERVIRGENGLGVRLTSLDRQIAAATIALQRGLPGEGPRYMKAIMAKESSLFELQARRDSLIRSAQLSAERADPSDAELEASIRSRPVPEGTAIVSYFLGRERGHVFVLTRDTLVVRTLEGEPAIRRAASAFIRSTKTIRLTEARQTAAAMHEQLIAAIVPSLRGIRRLVIVPEGRLAALPFEALAPAKSSPGSGANGFSPFLIRSYDVVYSQSVSSYFTARPFPDDARLSRSTRFAGFAPMFSDRDSGSVTSSGFVSYNGRAYPSLRYSGKEVQEIARHFQERGYPAVVHTGVDASKVRFVREAGEGGILHLATHGVIDEQRPLLSALLFGPTADSSNKDDGVLYAGEASTLVLPADLVVLGSCESGVGRIAGSEGMLAMSRSFFKAGAKNIMYALWPVGDRQTASLMKVFYEGLLRGETFAHSLREAKLQLIRERSTAFPSKWAGFVLMAR